MWYADPIHLHAIDEIKNGPDRVVGVVAGAIIESYLTSALVQEYRTYDTPYASKTRKEIFSPDGPMGAFGAKNGLAYLSGLITEEAHRDLRTLIKIRNHFAHVPNTSSFTAEAVVSLCNNLILVHQPQRINASTEVRKMPDGSTRQVDSMAATLKGDGLWVVSLRLVDHKAAIATSKGQFIATAKIFSAAFTLYHNNELNKPII